MIGFMPTPDGLSAPRSYGNQHNQATPRTAGNRGSGNIGISRRPPNFMPQQPQQIGIQQGAQPQQSTQQPQQRQQPLFFGGGLDSLLNLPQQQQLVPQPQFGQRRAQTNLNFGKQYYGQA